MYNQDVQRAAQERWKTEAYFAWAKVMDGLANFGPGNLDFEQWLSQRRRTAAVIMRKLISGGIIK